MCKASIIVPLYNGETTIERCLKSLCRQTLKDIEILVIDDGSTDNGATLVQKYAEKDPRIKLYAQKNQGQGAARNLGIQKATGKYIGFVDCDDFVAPQMYQIMTNVLEKTESAVAICQEKNVFIRNGETKLISETKFSNKDTEVYSNIVVLEWLLNYTYLSLNSMCYKVIERKILLESNVFFPENYRYAEDLVFSVGILSHVQQVAIVPQSLYYYVHNRDSFTYSYSLKHAEDIYYDWKEIQEYLQLAELKLNINNFSLGMNFSSIKQIWWRQNKNRKDRKEVRILEKKWKFIRKKCSWRPVSMKNTPLSHKIKIYVAYFHLIKPTLSIIRLLYWIPLFKFMT